MKCIVTEQHYREGTSDKFYRVYCIGTRVLVQYGRRGTAGQWQTKDFSVDYLAREHAHKQYGEKQAKGYVDTGYAEFDADHSTTTLDLNRLFDKHKKPRGSVPVPSVVTGRAAEREKKEEEEFKKNLLAMRKSLSTKAEGEPGHSDLETELASALAKIKGKP